MKLLIALLLSIGLVSCDEQASSPIFGDTRRVDVGINIRVYLYPDTKAVTKAYAQHARYINRKFDGLERVAWILYSDTAPYRCVFHLPEITYQTDPRFKSWGHELGHCVYGKFHNDPPSDKGTISMIDGIMDGMAVQIESILFKGEQ